MRCRKVLPTAFLVLFLATGISAFRAQNTSKPKQQKAEYPIVDLNAPEPADPEVRAKRKKKGEKYNGATSFPLNPARENVLQNSGSNFLPGTPAFPFSESVAVIIGTVTDAHAHLSEDRGYVYSEFDILVEDVIKDDARSPITVGKTVAAERPGGRVLVRPGNIHEFRSYLNPLGVKSRYVLFLSRRGDDYDVFTAYKLEEGRVYPVDDYFREYEGASEEDFMRELRQAAATSTAEPPRSAVEVAPEAARPVDEPPDAEPTPNQDGTCQLPSPPPCVAPRNDRQPRFSPGTVAVTYNPDHFSPQEVQAITNGYMAWDNLGNVTFSEPAPSRDRPVGSAGNTLHFEEQDQPTDERGGARDARVDAEGSCTGSGCVVHATVFLKRGLPLTARAYCQNNRGYIEYNEYEQLVAHEVGHPLGLQDTYTQTENSRGISIMDGRSYHLRNSIVTDCDKQIIAQTYPRPTPTPTPTPTCVDADGDGWCNDVDCNDNHPYETNNCERPYHYERYYEGPGYNCYNVYEPMTTYTCVDGVCSNPRTEYVLIYSFCGW